MTFFTLTVYGLATFRLAVMLSDDIGPWRIFSRLRSVLKREAKKNPAVRASAVHRGITCIRCDSVWIAFPVSLYARYRLQLLDWVQVVGDVFLIAMALSAVAILLNRIPEAK